MRIDLHSHSTRSDGTDDPGELVAKAAVAGLDAVGLCDHDTFSGHSEASAAAREHGVLLIPGIEISTSYLGASIHLLAYACDTTNAALNAELELMLEAREGRTPRMCAKLTELGMPLTVADVRRVAGSAKAIGRPHIADALIAKGYVANRREAFDRFLGNGRPASVHRYATELPKAISLVHDAKGVAVVAHPWSRGALQVVTEEVLADLVRETGLDGIEVAHEEHDQDARNELAAIADRLDLVPTGGSDYHGTGKVGHALGCNLTSEASLKRLAQRASSRGGELVPGTL